MRTSKSYRLDQSIRNVSLHHNSATERIRNALPRPLALAMVAALFAGCTGGIAEPDRTRSAGTDRLTDEERLREAYTKAFYEACEEVWSNSPDGNLYYAGTAYTEDDCKEELDETEADDASDEYDAEDQGREDGFDAAFDLSPSGRLCYSDECWERYDF